MVIKLYANKRQIDDHIVFEHFGLTKEFVHLFASDGQIVCVLAVENSEGQYYGFVPMDGTCTLIFCNRHLLDMCFPYGLSGEEKAGTGHEVRLNIIEIGEAGMSETESVLKDCALFRFWIKMCEKSPTSVARALANCVAPDDYRKALQKLATEVGDTEQVSLPIIDGVLVSVKQAPVAWFVDEEHAHDWAVENYFGHWLLNSYPLVSLPLFTDEQIAEAQQKAQELLNKMGKVDESNNI